MSIPNNIHIIQTAISQAAEQCNRNPQEITLLAVSKGQASTRIRQAYHAGLRHFGENYWQEAQHKMQSLQDLTDIIWYFIGHLQSNKTKVIATHCDWVLSVHNEKIARLLDNHRSPHQAPLNVCIAVNLDAEISKSGISIEAVLPLAQLIIGLPRLTLRGLMTIPKPEADASLQLTSFKRLTTLFHQLNSVLPTRLDTLSMGMSDDFQTAIHAGSTMIRIGQAIFGPRGDLLNHECTH